MDIQGYIAEWKQLAETGQFQQAEEVYYDKVLPVVIEGFTTRYSSIFQEKDHTLFSILGYSPEPIILTAKAIKPQKHFIFTNIAQKEINNIMNEFLEGNYELITFKDEGFSSIYKTLKKSLIVFPSESVILDITGGKKSMVTSAAIFGKDYGCKIVYVDFSEYIKELRKPLPGSEILNVVYDPLRDQPELFIK